MPISSHMFHYFPRFLHDMSLLKSLKASPIPISPPRNMLQELGRLCRLRWCEGICLRATGMGKSYPEKMRKIHNVRGPLQFYQANREDSWKCVIPAKRQDVCQKIKKCYRTPRRSKKIVCFVE